MRLLIAGFLLFPLLLNAQFQLGWRTDTYAGINSALVNPAAPGRTPYSWDLNLGEVSTFLANNYGYLRETSITQLLRNRDKDLDVFFARDLPSDLNPSDDVLVYDYFENNSYYGQQLNSILGPSFSVRVAPQTRIGVFTRWQTLFSGKGLDEDLGFYQWDAIPSQQVFTLDKFRGAAASWTEVGLNISQSIFTNNGELILGLSARRLWGQRAGYLISEEDFSLSKLPNTIGLEGTDFSLEAGFTSNAANDDDFTDSPGRGWAADIGLIYRIDLGDDFYRWEFGAAVLDIGSLLFKESELHRFNSDQLATTLTDSYNNLDTEQGFSQAAAQLSEDVFGDNSISRVSDEFNLRLPTTISLQATYAFTEWAKVEANVLAGIAPGGASLTRNTTLALTPRIDRHWWGIGMPVSLYAMNDLRIGLAARLGPLFIGTDQLGAFTNSKQLSGGDFYVGVKFFPLGLNRNGSKKNKKRGRRRGGKDVECYKF
jgi:hypothetical protein